MKNYVITILIISLIVTYLVVVAKYANTTVSEMPAWVFWLLK